MLKQEKEKEKQFSGDEGDFLSICYMDQAPTRSIHVQLLLNGKPSDLRVDTGVAVPMLSERRVQSIHLEVQLQNTDVINYMDIHI